MHVRKPFAAVCLGLALSLGAAAQTAPDSGSTQTQQQKPAKKKKSTKKAKKGTTPAPAPQKNQVDDETRKALEAAPAPTPAPAPSATPAPAAPPAEAAAPPGPADDTPPVLTHTPVTVAKRGKPLSITAHAEDPSGVFGPVLYLARKGLPATDAIPMRMLPVKGSPGDYAVEIPPALVSVDELQYWIEAWDEAGNGPARAGSPEEPLAVKVEQEKKIVVKAPEPPPPPANVVVKPKGAPPAITHSAVAHADKGKPIEINARLVGDTGVQGATVMFRHSGEKDYKALPMGNIGGDDYTATIPAQMATADIEYYLEAFDKYGNGPGRSGAPNVPYVIKVAEPKPVAPPPVAQQAPAQAAPQQHVAAKPQFRPNPGRAAAWLMMGAFVGGAVFAGGEALAFQQENSAYQHTFDYEGRLEPSLLAKANTDGQRARTAAIVSVSALVAAVVLFVVFPDHADAGSGGDVGVKF